MKKFPEDIETTLNTGGIKGETLEKHKGELLEKHKGEQTEISKSKMHIKFERTEKHSSDASAGTSSDVKGTVTQKGKGGESAATTEKQHYTIKMTNSSKKAAEDGVEPITLKEGAATTQKKHVSNVKWSGNKAAVDTTGTQSTKSSNIFLKIGDIKGEK